MYTKVNLRTEDLLFPNPTRCVLIAPSGAGKSTAILNCLRYRDYLFAQKFTKVIYVNPNVQNFLPLDEGYLQTMRDILSPIEFVVKHEIPSLEEVLSHIQEDNSHLFCLFDDMNEEAWCVTKITF